MMIKALAFISSCERESLILSELETKLIPTVEKKPAHCTRFKLGFSFIVVRSRQSYNSQCMDNDKITSLRRTVVPLSRISSSRKIKSDLVLTTTFLA